MNDAPRLLETAIEQNRPEDRLDGIGKNRFTQESTAFPFPHAESEVLPDVEFSRQLGQGTVADQTRSQATQITFGGLGTAFEQQLCDHEIQQAVAEELKALVMARAEAAVGQGLLQQPRIGEPIVDAGDTIDRSHHSTLGPGPNLGCAIGQLARSGSSVLKERTASILAIRWVSTL